MAPSGWESAEFRAPWSRTLKVTSVFSVLLLAGMMPLLALALPPTPLGRAPYVALVLMAPCTLLGGALFMVRGYTLAGSTLRVHRLLWDTVVPLDGLRKAWADPTAMKGSLRLFGNGGLFSFTGWFGNRRLGRYRAFATDPARAVVLELGERKIVVTPEHTRSFLDQLAKTPRRFVLAPLDKPTGRAIFGQ